MTEKGVGDPGIFATASFGFSLLVLGVVETAGLHEAAPAALFAVLYAALGETIGGIIDIIRGKTYLGSIVTTFGLWLLGFYFLGSAKVGHIATALYLLALLPPIAILWVPAIKLKRGIILNGAFAALFGLVVFLGLGHLVSSHTLAQIGGLCSLAAAFFIWSITAEHVKEIYKTPT